MDNTPLPNITPDTNNQLPETTLPLTPQDPTLEQKSELTTQHKAKPKLIYAGILATIVLIMGILAIYIANTLPSQTVENSNAQIPNELIPTATVQTQQLNTSQEETEIQNLEIEDPQINNDYQDVENSLQQL